MSIAAEIAVGAVRAYQWTVRPLIGANCRFWPSCSDYAVEALRTHGALRGSALAGWRILRCNPWCDGGYDPVPPCRHGAGRTLYTDPAAPAAERQDYGKSL
jgi:putative membrane protein insertion efficiency factor